MATSPLANHVEVGFSAEADEQMIANARSLVPLLAQHAQQHEDEGQLSPEVVSALSEAGFWKMAIPRRWGGLSISANAMARAAGELAKGCPSSAWVIGVMNSNGWLVSLMPDAIQEEVFAKGVARISGVGSPPGKARKVAGGYIVSGRWGYGSGSHHAEWVHCPIAEPDGAEGPGGVFVAPIEDIQILRTWNVTGMKGTGSNTLVADELFVPKHRVILYRDGGMGSARPGAVHTGEVTDFWAPLPLLRSKGLGVLHGTVSGLLDAAIGANAQRPIVHTNYKQKIASPVFQAGIGEAAAWIRAAGTLMDKTTRSLDAAALGRRTTTYEERAENRGDAALALQLMNLASDKLMNLMGSSAFTTENPAQRFWRDYNIGARHAVNLSEPGFEVSGRALLGMPPEDNITLPDFI